MDHMYIYRYNGKWYKVIQKPYEPERQTVEVAWNQIREKAKPEVVYRKFYEKQREDARILYPSFRKDDI
jgi:hypothetical protein